MFRKYRYELVKSIHLEDKVEKSLPLSECDPSQPGVHVSAAGFSAHMNSLPSFCVSFHTPDHHMNPCASLYTFANLFSGNSRAIHALFCCESEQ